MIKWILRSLRGGSWNLGEDRLRASERERTAADSRLPIDGFRLVIGIKEKEE